MAEFDNIVMHALSERKRLAAEIAKIDELLAAAEKANGGSLPQPATNPPLDQQHFAGALGNGQRRRKMPTTGVINGAREILLENGRPMTRFEIADELQHRNIEIGGTDKAKNVGTILWRSPEFVSTGEGYWVAEEID